MNRQDKQSLVGECVVEPRKGKREEPVPPRVIMSFTPPDMEIMARALFPKRTAWRKVDFWTLKTSTESLPSLALAGPAFGAPAAVILLERLIVLGAKVVVGVGSCGSLQPEASIGCVILPDSSVVEEGTSPHYLLSGVVTRPDPLLSGKIKEALTSRGIKVLQGRVWTTDALFRETREKVVSFQREGVLAVDMESSALMTVSSYRGISFASVLVVSDELASLSWHKGFNTGPYRRTLQEVTRTVALCLEELSFDSNP